MFKKPRDFEGKFYEEKNLEHQLRLWQGEKFFDRPTGFPLEIKKKIFDIIRQKRKE